MSELSTGVAKKRILQDVTVEVVPNVFTHSGMSTEDIAKQYERWARDFMAFMRDHRSQDLHDVRVTRIYKDVCSGCDNEWETMDDGTACAWCGEQIAK